jgi:hypothetical protein
MPEMTGILLWAHHHSEETVPGRKELISIFSSIGTEPMVS